MAWKHACTLRCFAIIIFNLLEGAFEPHIIKILALLRIVNQIFYISFTKIYLRAVSRTLHKFATLNADTALVSRLAAAVSNPLQ